jgi:hypothetical protein
MTTCRPTLRPWWSRLFGDFQARHIDYLIAAMERDLELDRGDLEALPLVIAAKERHLAELRVKLALV